MPRWRPTLGRLMSPMEPLRIANHRHDDTCRDEPPPSDGCAAPAGLAAVPCNATGVAAQRLKRPARGVQHLPAMRRGALLTTGLFVLLVLTGARPAMAAPSHVIPAGHII